MRNNIFPFGDMTFKQLNGTAMGTTSPPPPPPPYTMIYYGLHESKLKPQHQKHVIFYKHFIYNVLGIWLPHPNPQTNEHLWDEFTKSINNYPGLIWEFNAPSDKVDFMDLTITITEDQNSTFLFEKPLNLHLYIPLTPPIHLGSYQALSTAHSSEFLPCAQIKMIGSYTHSFLTKVYKHVVTRVTKSNHSFINP